MTNHDYLNLAIGDIEQYAMVVKKKDIIQWKRMGWLEHTEIGLPEGDEEAFMLYGEIRKGEQLIFNRPKLLREVAKKSIIGLEIIGYSSHLGTYGMGGAGFFGLLLSNDEYLTYAAWNAGNYVLINDAVVECNPNLYHKTTPWISNYGDNQTWDHLTNFINGGKIVDYALTDDRCEITVSKSENTFKVEFVKNDRRLPRKVGRKRNAYKKGSISDYILFQHKNGRLIV